MPGATASRVHGVELHEDSARAARAILSAHGADARIEVGDFFDYSTSTSYDAVIGNPPYVRYQEFTGAARTKARRAALEVGVPLSGLASSWAAFTVQAARLVAPTG